MSSSPHRSLGAAGGDVVQLSLAARFGAMERALTGTPLWRFVRWLRQQRSTHISRTGGKADASSAPVRPLLPSHLPAAPWGAVAVCVPRGGQRRRRFDRNRLAWRWTEWVLAAATFWQLGCPKNVAAYARLMGPWGVDIDQELAAHRMFSTVRAFCRLDPDIQPGPGRGLGALMTLLTNIETSERAPSGAGDLERLAQAAVYVDPTCMSVPDVAGTCDPAVLLSGRRQREYANFDKLILPPSDWTLPLPRPCYMVRLEDEVAMRDVMLRSGMAQLIDERDVERGPDGRLLLQGLFDIMQTSVKRRLICDKRPANAGERRLNWLHLPLGVMFTRLFLPPTHGIRGSGSDLDKYFYRLLNSPALLKRSAFGRAIAGADVSSYGGVAGRVYRLALRVHGMGGLNSSDVGQGVHEDVLVRGGCMVEGTVMRGGDPIPASSVLEVVYQDDRLVVGIVPNAEMPVAAGADKDLCDRGRLAHAAAGLPRSEAKGFGFDDVGGDKPGSPSFVSLGTGVHSDSGLVGVPRQKRVNNAALGLWGASLPRVTLQLMRRLTAQCIFPFQHFKPLNAVFHRAFKWQAGLPAVGGRAWAADVRDEMAMAALLLPFAETNIRTPISSTISCTDATVHTGAAVEVTVGQELSNAFFRAAEYRGDYVRLDDRDRAFPPANDRLVPEAPFIADVVGALDWEVTSSHAFAETSHINLQETGEIRLLLRKLSRRSLAPLRHTNGTDSNVALGAWGKGRSSSFLLGGQLRVSLGWALLAQITIANFRIGTKHNPADDPTRDAVLRTPTVKPPWLAKAARATPMPAHPSLRFPRHLRRCRECFAGRGGLSQALRGVGLRVGVPIESHPSKGVTVLDHDMERFEVLYRMQYEIELCLYVYLHFGLVCSTWGRAGRLNGGTRTLSAPAGDGSLPREVRANLIATWVARLCLLIMASGGYFSIENPIDSYLFHFPPIKALFRNKAVFSVKLDQCAYCLSLPGAAACTYCLKRTLILTNMSSLEALSRKCPGISASHKHETAWGSRCVDGVNVKLAAAAGRYPERLTASWAAAVVEGLAR